jgi:hypothetical protein
MVFTIRDINSVRLEELSDERSSQATGTRRLNQSRQPSMAMGGASMAPNGDKNDQGVHFYLSFASYHLCTVLLGPPGLFACLLCDLRTSPDHNRPHSLVLTMPRERGKPRRSTRNKNAITRDNRLTASQRALIAHFSRPHRPTRSTQSTLRIPKVENPPTLPQTQAQSPLRIPKMETPSLTEHSPPPPQHLPTILNTVKEEALPSIQHPGPKLDDVEPPSAPQPGPSLVKMEGSPPRASLPSPSTSHDFQPRWWEGGCIVEEEIPPSWQLTGDGENPITTEDTGKDGGEEGSHYTYHLAAEHLELLFDIRQRQDEQVHGQRTIHQRLDLLFEALSDAPPQAQCPTCKQKFIPVYTAHGHPGSPKA